MDHLLSTYNVSSTMFLILLVYSSNNPMKYVISSPLTNKGTEVLKLNNLFRVTVLLSYSA